MKISLKDLNHSIKGKILTDEDNKIEIEFSGGYVSDLLSDVMGNAKNDQIWITIMQHLNVIAVASLIGIKTIIFGKGIIPAQTVIVKANAEKICLVSSKLPVFDISGKLYQLLHNRD